MTSSLVPASVLHSLLVNLGWTSLSCALKYGADYNSLTLSIFYFHLIVTFQADMRDIHNLSAQLKVHQIFITFVVTIVIDSVSSGDSPRANSMIDKFKLLHLMQMKTPTLSTLTYASTTQ